MGGTSALVAQSTEMSSGDNMAAPATSCHTPMATVAVSRKAARPCSQMSPIALLASRPFPLAVTYNVHVNRWSGGQECIAY